jgi:hypothetical protein
LFKKETNNNVLTDAHIKQIMTLFDNKENVDIHYLISATMLSISARSWSIFSTVVFSAALSWVISTMWKRLFH